jgi:hypothetical protein
MYYSTVLLGALTASLARGTPVSLSSRQVDTSSIAANTVQITLRFGDTSPNNPNTDILTLGPQDTVFAGLNLRNSVEINFGPGVDPNLRCKATAIGGDEIVVQRGQNIDNTFAPGAAGAWTFLRPETAQVQEIICDSSFTKADPSDSDVTITFSNSETSDSVIFKDVVDLPQGMSSNVVNPDGWTTVSLKVGKLIEKQDLRCQILDPSGNVITLNRGQNLGRSTFSDGGSAAPWAFADPILSPVSEVICDQSFVAGQ